MVGNASHEQKEAALKVLLHESDHVQGAISRLVSTLNALFGVVLPAAFGVVLFSAGRGDQHFSPDVLGFALIGIVSLALIYSSSLWVEALKYIRYKYTQLHPRMYRLIGRSEEPNFVQYLASTTEGYAWLPSVLFQGVVISFGWALSFLMIEFEAPSPWRNLLLLGAGLLTTAAAISAVGVWLFGRRVMGQIAESFRDQEHSS